MSQETKKEELPSNSKNISRRNFLISTAVAVTGLVGTGLALNKGRLLREIGEFLFPKETDKRWRTAKEVIKATYFSSKESFQNTVIAINQLNIRFGLEETIPFKDFEEENSWLRIKRERVSEHWWKFWNLGPMPLGFVFPFLGSFSEKEKEEREVFSNKSLFLPWIFCSLELIQKFGGEERFREILGISGEKIIIDPKNKRVIIDCSEGIFNIRIGDVEYRFFPYGVMGILEEEFSDKNLFVISFSDYLNWLEKFLNKPLPESIRENLEEIFEILRNGGNKSLFPLSPEGLFLDNWRIVCEGGKKQIPSFDLSLISSLSGFSSKLPVIHSSSVSVRLNSAFKDWNGPFEERINPFQIVSVDFNTFKERGKGRLLIRYPKTSFLPYFLNQIGSVPVGIWLAVGFGRKA